MKIANACENRLRVVRAGPGRRERKRLAHGGAQVRELPFFHAPVRQALGRERADRRAAKLLQPVAAR
jgi:hypothetical protein